MATDEALVYSDDPNYQAYLAESVPPWRLKWTTERPDTPVPQALTPEQRQRVIQENLDIIDFGVRKLAAEGKRPNDDDAYQDGAVGLCDAAERFDGSKGAQFATYAQYRVKGAIVDGVRSYDRLAGKGRKQAQVVSQLNNTRAISIFSPAFRLGHGDIVTIEDTVADTNQPNPEEIVEATDAVGWLHALIDLLETRQQQVILLTAQSLGQKSIASTLGVSVSTVGRDLRKARTFLKEQVEQHLF